MIRSFIHLRQTCIFLVPEQIIIILITACHVDTFIPLSLFKGRFYPHPQIFFFFVWHFRSDLLLGGFSERTLIHYKYYIIIIILYYIYLYYCVLYTEGILISKTACTSLSYHYHSCVFLV